MSGERYVDKTAECAPCGWLSADATEAYRKLNTPKFDRAKNSAALRVPAFNKLIKARAHARAQDALAASRAITTPLKPVHMNMAGCWAAAWSLKGPGSGGVHA
ncbi:hypothetical protein [Sphaerimonospora thailandensis]|uniref:Uncharacterized protein n=1 Tax=Sphaerimonospora thailandensis TaxID=795644 RepID=A0A8J3VZH2_9ACTN|nr:hypothetical protein [Sphaerimonospora thailandensis]GIH70472.1 hypothetical protein Mth01_27250 [Sphaerimonospora thailandensis]